MILVVGCITVVCVVKFTSFSPLISGVIRKKKKAGGEIKPFIPLCELVRRLCVLKSDGAERKTIHLCFLYHQDGGKRRRSYCAIAGHKSRGCELANPATHHSGVCV